MFVSVCCDDGGAADVCARAAGDEGKSGSASQSESESGDDVALVRVTDGERCVEVKSARVP